MQRFPVWPPRRLSHGLNLTSVIAGRRCLNRVFLGASTRWMSTKKNRRTRNECEEAHDCRPPPGVPSPSFSSGGLVFSEPQSFDDDVAEPPLSPEQQNLVDLILTGRNVFYTGAAGTGKSHVLRAAVKQLRRLGHRVHVVAPTGKAALAVDGITTWSYAGWTPMAHARPISLLRKWALNKMTCARLANTDVLIIDEISMVENHHLSRLDEIMKEARAHAAWNDIKQGHGCVPRAQISHHIQTIRRSAFGGCQIIATGDFFQLPPVLPFQHCIECGLPLLKEFGPGDITYYCPSGHGTWLDSDKWAFHSKVWSNANFTHVELRQIHRQKKDPTFINILNRVRSGTHTYDDVMVLANPSRKTKDLTNAVRLYPTRFEVAQHNDNMLRELTTRPHDFFTRDSFHWNEAAHPHLEAQGNRGADYTLTALREHKYEPFLRLKVGMPVILLSNIDVTQGLVNGSQGVIIDFTTVNKFIATADNLKPRNRKRRRMKNSTEDRYIDAMIDSEVYKYIVSNKYPVNVLPVVQFDNGRTRIIYPDCSDHRMGNDTKPINTERGASRWDMPSVLCRTQIPLVAGWAMSIHKAQGMSLGKVIVDLTRAFAEGQVYVALSRARSLDGLKVEGDPRGLFVRREGNPDVRRFYLEKFRNKAVQRLPT